MSVIAEGIETTEQHHTVTALGCDSSQGFYFAPPMAAANIETLLQTGGWYGRRHTPPLKRAPTGFEGAKPTDPDADYSFATRAAVLAPRTIQSALPCWSIPRHAASQFDWGQLFGARGPLSCDAFGDGTSTEQRFRNR